MWVRVAFFKQEIGTPFSGTKVVEIVLTLLDTRVVPTAAPAKGLTVTRCPSVRKALGFNGDS
jgi:hypothetical protein